MKYIIPVYVQNEFDTVEKMKVFEDALSIFIKHRLHKMNAFEVHDSKFDQQRELCGDNKILRFCTTNMRFCYLGASIVGYDFNSEIGTYFLEVEADENFKATGTFCPRFLIHRDSPEFGGQVVGLDYIVKGVELSDNKN